MAEVDERAKRAMLFSLACFLVWRIAYHAAYMIADPFAHATFSDGALYEADARDVLAHPPLGTRPFYLQGAYAYLLASGMMVWPRVTAGLVLQLACAAAALWAGCRALLHAFGPRSAWLASLALLAYFPLAFYENKFLSASLGIDANLLVWLGFAAFAHQRRRRNAFALGGASALSILARPNLLLAVPFTLAAVALVCERARLRSNALACLAGLFLGLAPMSLRNALVTGTPTVFPAHGGGTSFYIGNNPHADGRWNTAGGLLSGQVGLEREELLLVLGLPRRSETEDAAAIGSALYARAFAFIREQPQAAVRLQIRKLWLLLGNDEISQDYDVLGERALLGPSFGHGVAFGVLLALAVLGVTALRRRTHEPQTARAWLFVLLGQAAAVLAANIVYFTSSQHRLPLAVVCCALAGPGANAAWARLRALYTHEKPSNAPGVAAWSIAVLLLAQSFVPREHRTRPTLAHWYNLAVVQEQQADLVGAVASLGNALARRPDDAVFLVEHASLLRRLGQFEQARVELDHVRTLSQAPDRVYARERLERALLAARQRTNAQAVPR
jgi:hypothetical protein